jgi:CheY-like chemotaxis protein
MNKDLLELPVEKQHLKPTSTEMSLATFVRVAPRTDGETSEQDNYIPSSDVPKRVILLVTHDTKLDHGLRTAAKTAGHIIIRVESLSDALRTVRANCTDIALLDLDMSAERGWDAADGLMQTPKCPPVALVTGRTEQFDMRMAIEGGVLLDKTAEPRCILQAVNNILEAPRTTLEERNAIQRVLIRWLRPLHWPSQPIVSGRFWGINE